MSLSRTLKRRNEGKDRICFCALCRKILDVDEDLDLHFQIIHPGIDKEGPLDEQQLADLDEYSRSLA